MPIKHYSYTRLNLYDNCPLAYKRKYIEKRSEEKSVPLLIGSGAHKLAELYDRHLLEHNLATDITAAPAIIEAAYADREMADLKREHWDEAERVFRYFVESHILEPANVVGIEEMLKISMPDLGCLFWAKIDRLETSGEKAIITDYKSDWNVRSQADVEKDFQLAVYAWSVARLFPHINEFLVRLDFIRHGTVREVELTMADYERTEKRICQMIAAIEADKKFAPTPGAHCSWCSWSEDCTAISNMTIACGCPEDAHRVASELALLKKQVGDREDALRSYCTVAGPVTAGGLTWAHWTERTKEWDVREFVATLGDPAYDYLSVNSTKVKPLLKKDGERLERLFTEKVATKFKSKKAGETL